jgi:hypothetical protein
LASTILTLALPALLTLAGAEAPGRPLLIPQVEGERQGAIIGRAIACGAPAARTDEALRVARERIMSALGRAMTEERFVPELNQALFFETSLPKPSDAACAKAMEAFERLEKAE